jgi:hypothetical protein
MNPVETLGLALGAGFSSGLNLYATIATLGLLQRFGVIHLPAPLQVLSHPWVLGIAIALYAIEFFADKIPYVDTVWDAIHTVIRPPAAALLAYSAAGGAPPEWRWGAALLAGGVALTSHGTKASLVDLDGHRSPSRHNCRCGPADRASRLSPVPSLPILAPRPSTPVRHVTGPLWPRAIRGERVAPG